METIFINSENSKTSEPHIFKLNLTEKLKLKDPKTTWLSLISVFITLGKTLNQNTTTINLKFLPQFIE